jgi:hypothetical protein
MKKIFFLCVLFVFILAEVHACEEFEIKIIYDKKAEYSKEILCTKKTADNMIFYLSKGCVDDACDVLKRKKNTLVIKNYNSQIGSPGFKICAELGGIPQIFEFKKSHSTKWESTERCLFEKNEFVEISLLTREWKKHLRKK